MPRPAGTPTAGVDVPRDRLEGALELLAEMVLHPTFPEREVDRLRDERLNDLLQARADPRRRADEAFVDTIYAPNAPYHRPAGGTRETVASLGPAQLRRAYERGLDPARATFIVGGELAGLDVRTTVERLFGDWTAPRRWPVAAPSPTRRHVTSGSSGSSTDRGRPVRDPDRPPWSATADPGLPCRLVMSAILGGLFNSHLKMNLREDKGYTYGAGAGFDLRRGSGPFAGHAAVNTEATVPAITETLDELARMREEDVTDAELRAARDFLVGVFPLRFETAGAVVGALSGLVVHDLGIEELIGYRASIEGVSSADVTAAARAHLLLEAAAIVVVGDADQFGAALEAAGVGPVVINVTRARPRPGHSRRRSLPRLTGRTRPGRQPEPRSRTCPGARTSPAAAHRIRARAPRLKPSRWSCLR